MARVSLIALFLLIVLGLVFSFVPSTSKPPLGEVTLENVSMVLYPAADPNAKWTFKAGIVKYNPDSRSSVATELSEGQRLVKGKLDLSLYAKEITIDSNDNLQTQTARIFIPEGCWGLKLGREGAAPVQIDQNAGYRAPFIDVNSTSSSYTGEDFIASFDMRNTDSRHNHDRVLDESVRSCNSVKAGIQQ